MEIIFFPHRRCIRTVVEEVETVFSCASPIVPEFLKRSGSLFGARVAKEEISKPSTKFAVSTAKARGFLSPPTPFLFGLRGYIDNVALPAHGLLLVLTPIVWRSYFE